MYADELFEYDGLKYKDETHVYLLKPYNKKLRDTLKELNLRFCHDTHADTIGLELYIDGFDTTIHLATIAGVGACCGSVVMSCFRYGSSSYTLYNYKNDNRKKVEVNLSELLEICMDVIRDMYYTNVTYYCADHQEELRELLVGYGFSPIHKFLNYRSGNYVEILNFDFPPIEREEDEEDDNY